MRLPLFAILILLCAPAGAEVPPCGAPDRPCMLADGRSYHLRLPDGWDGKTPLPVLMHFHGWGRQGTLTVRHRRIAGATRHRGVLLVGPNGEGGSWSFWTQDSPDVAFADAVLADVARRLPVDGKRVMVSGYSYGSAMAWRYACARGGRLYALLAVAGSPRDGPAPCRGPRHVAHVHGTRDTVMAYPFGPGGAVTGPVAPWLAAKDCAGAPARSAWAAFAILPFQRYRWECADGGAVTLDAHGRGHFIPRGWIAHWLDRLGFPDRRG